MDQKQQIEEDGLSILISKGFYSTVTIKYDFGLKFIWILSSLQIPISPYTFYRRLTLILEASLQCWDFGFWNIVMLSSNVTAGHGQCDIMYDGKLSKRQTVSPENRVLIQVRELPDLFQRLDRAKSSLPTGGPRLIPPKQQWLAWKDKP